LFKQADNFLEKIFNAGYKSPSFLREGFRMSKIRGRLRLRLRLRELVPTFSHKECEKIIN
jgi:hypothetical protein